MHIWLRESWSNRCVIEVLYSLDPAVGIYSNLISVRVEEPRPQIFAVLHLPNGHKPLKSRFGYIYLSFFSLFIAACLYSNAYIIQQFNVCVLRVIAGRGLEFNIFNCCFNATLLTYISVVFFPASGRVLHSSVERKANNKLTLRLPLFFFRLRIHILHHWSTLWFLLYASRWHVQTNRDIKWQTPWGWSGETRWKKRKRTISFLCEYQLWVGRCEGVVYFFYS